MRHQVASHSGRAVIKPRSSVESPKAKVDNLVEAAVKLVEEKEVGKLTIDHVAASLKLTRATPFYHFSSRISLLTAIAHKGFDRLTARLREERDAGKRAERTVKALADTYAKFALKNQNLYET